MAGITNLGSSQSSLELLLAQYVLGHIGAPLIIEIDGRISTSQIVDPGHWHKDRPAQSGIIHTKMLGTPVQPVMNQHIRTRKSYGTEGVSTGRYRL
ncbi:hypothetical protein NLI96_g9562 [Meripilus lineatus]|uniref:Uncharacterized protein n=1 Tax=Meripilus lineatus TaxID=2056292 RepID=A0AAD5YAV5_9APHY|nr:hypothetical protein NLI96_g9562 [Physisporinus lineatus]